MIVVWLFLLIPRVCRQFVIVVFPDHTHFLFPVLKGLNTILRGARNLSFASSKKNGIFPPPHLIAKWTLKDGLSMSAAMYIKFVKNDRFQKRNYI